MKKNKTPPGEAGVCAVQTAASPPLSGFGQDASPDYYQMRLYKSLRENVPVIDAAVTKLVRLTGGFCVRCSDQRSQAYLDDFLRRVPVNGCCTGLENFIAAYFEQLLTCGTAIGEILTDAAGRPAALYNAPLKNVELTRGKNGFDVEMFVTTRGVREPVKYPELIVLSALNPKPGAFSGVSLLHGLPFVGEILLKIFRTTGVNWDRCGNVRFAVTYKPQNDALDKAYAKERAMQVAKEWSSAMNSRSVKDFIAVGDVQIKAIGADMPILNSEVPVRQLIEQIVAKTGLPPFLLGLSWSTTERMSSQQADALTSELEELKKESAKSQDKAELARRARQLMKQSLGEFDDITNPVTPPDPDEDYVLPRPLRVGDTVLLVDIGKTGEVTALADKRGDIEVTAGILKMRTPLKNLRLQDKPQPQKTTRTAPKSGGKDFRPEGGKAECDIRGMTVEDGILELERHMDRCMRQSLSEITVIHGKGTGALRKGIQDYLRRCKYVKSYRLGTFGEGEAGVTVVTLK